MPSKPPIPLLPGRFYHLYNHAIGDENIFRKRENYFYFLRQYRKYIVPVAHTFAYNLLPNHFHLFLRIKNEKELLAHFHSLRDPMLAEVNEIDYAKFTIQQFSNFMNGYVKAYNKMFKRKGALVLDFVRRKEVSESAYFINLINYIHWNAVLHGLCDRPEDWEFSSLHAFLKGGKTQLQIEEVLKWFSGKERFFTIHKSGRIQLPSDIDFA